MAKSGDTKTFCQGRDVIAKRGSCQEKICSIVRVVDYYLKFDMYGVRRKVEPRERVMTNRILFCERVPVRLGNAISCFTAMDSSEIKGAMDVHVSV